MSWLLFAFVFAGVATVDIIRTQLKKKSQLKDFSKEIQIKLHKVEKVELPEKEKTKE